MANIERTASAVWRGTLRDGTGQISSASGALQHVAYSHATRFEQAPGTNPDELLAAATAACFSMFLAATLSEQGYQPQRIATRATCILEPQQPSGWKITTMRLQTEATVDGLEAAAFDAAVQTSKAGCPVSQALAAITIEAEGVLLR